MVGKKVEGNEEQRRAAARQARQEGTTPSAQKETTGASKQRSHLPRHASHERKMSAVHQGKQEWQASREAEADVRGPAEPPRTFDGSETSEYTTDHEQVFAALTDAQQANDGEAVYLDEIAQRSGQDRDRTRTLLHDLTEIHHLVTQLHQTDSPDLGPRFEVKPRL